MKNLNGWVRVEDARPRSGEDVLVYYWDEGYDIHQIEMLCYWRKGDVLNQEDDIFSPLRGEKFEPVLAPADGFYVYEGDGDAPFRKYADVITHWQPLPQPPSNLKGMLAGLDQE